MKGVIDYNELYQLESSIVMFAKKSILYLVISSNSLSDSITECYVEHCFHVISGHKTVVTQLKLDILSFKHTGQQKFWLDKIDQKKFLIGLEV